MTDTAALWLWLFLAVTTALLLVPLYPAWREWVHPQDDGALTLSPTTTSAAVLTVPHIRLTADMPVRPQIEATVSIVALPGSRFEKLRAPRIDFGAADEGTALAITHLPDQQAQPAKARYVALEHLNHASPWGDAGWRVEGDCRIPAAHHLQGALVVTGQLSIEHDCLIEGDIKAHGDIRLAPRTVVTGALVGEKDITLDTACQVHGPVVCEKHLSLGRSVVLGQAQQTTSVSAERITTQAGTKVFGSVWAQKFGKVA
jgi:cytoskeletal protein CcmA (bactofilin family)